MPAIQDHGFVVGMAHPATHIHLRIATHYSPVLPIPFAIRKSPILLVRKAVRCDRADINRLPAKTIKLLAEMGPFLHRAR